MKKYLALFTFLLVISSCQEESFELHETESYSIPNFNFSQKKNDINLEQFIGALKSNRERLSELDIYEKGGCVKTAHVPRDYATIQEAVDAVCEYGNVLVKSGTYHESVAIITQGLSIKAIGDVMVVGGFGIDADDVKIHNFNIDNTNSAFSTVGIGSIGFNGLEAIKNNITGSGHIGIYFSTTHNSSIVQNNVSGPMDYGIYIDGYIPWPIGPGWGPSTENTIAQNTVSGITDTNGWGSGIQIRGNCDDNLIQGNEVYSCVYGISMWSSYPDLRNCDNNIVKNNIANDNEFTGIELGQGGMNNTIGPNNTANNNGDFGIALWPDSSDNHVFNNRASNNVKFDIANVGTNNTFKTNKVAKTLGVN